MSTTADRSKGIDIKGAKVFNKAGKKLEDYDIENLHCSYCHLLLRDAYQLIGCGHRYCSPCVEIVKKQKICPEDNEPINEGEARIDKGCQKEIQRLDAQCPGSANGCLWRDSLILLEDHMLECQYIEQDCMYGCGAKVTKQQWSSHLASCPNKPSSCSYCSQEVPPNKMEEHYKSCQGYPITCETCSRGVPREKLSIHKERQCPKKHAKCKFPGCTFEGLIEDINQHGIEHQYEMMHLISEFKHVKDENKSLREEVKSLKEHSDQLKKQVKALEGQVDTILPSLKTRVGGLENEVQNIRAEGRKTATEPDSSFRRNIPEGRYASTSSIYMDSGITYGSTQSGYSTSSSGYSSGSDDDIRNLGSRMNSLEQEMRSSIKNSIDEIKTTLSQTKSQVAGCVNTVETMQESVTRHAVTMEEVKLRQDILDVKTTHGIFIWKIPEINRRFGDAQARRTLSLYSPPFHASAHGYRMCIRAYLNGDGSGKGTHISVFFVLMKSEHDNLLPWPFRRPVTFQLINQDNPSSTISETFMPDVHSPSFQQPKSEMNVASGFPRFAKQSVLSDSSFTKGH